jgi:hypothetical protein
MLYLCTEAAKQEVGESFCHPCCIQRVLYPARNDRHQRHSKIALQNPCTTF